MLRRRSGQKDIPALSYSWLTPAYDLITRLITRESTFKGRLVKQAQIGKGQRVLDLGCGTATLTILIKQAYPDSEVIGLDSDSRIIRIARTKVRQARLDVKLNRGTAIALPYSDGSFDRVLSSLFFHHLATESKMRALKEIWRILRPGGELHIVDLGAPQNFGMYLISLIMRQLEETSDNIKGLLPKMIEKTGFVQVEEFPPQMTLFGTLSFLKAKKPER